MSKISIAGLDKAAVLAALYNRSAPIGAGFLQATPGDMTVEEARQYLGAGDDRSRMFPSVARKTLYFAYLTGRPLKVDLSGADFETGPSDRDNGQGAVARIVAKLRAQQPAEAANVR